VEKIAGDRDKNRLPISLPRLIRISSGFSFSPQSIFVVLPFFLPFYEKPLKTVGICIFDIIYHIAEKGFDCGIF